MTRPWKVLDRWTDGGQVLELRQRGDNDFLILDDGRVLMNSYSRRSEEELARLGCAGLGAVKQPHVLIAGLGMGFTLRAALDVLPPAAKVTVCEINKVVIDWCRGPLAAATSNAIGDPRVELRIEDVAKVIELSQHGSFHAIILDLYEGPNAANQRPDDPFYSSRAIELQRRALAPPGTLAVWSEDADAPYARRLASARFDVKTHSIGQGGRRHVVYVGCTARRP
jgi:spermidine synthase